VRRRPQLAAPALTAPPARRDARSVVVADETVARLSQAWRRFADEECGTYSPLYAAISGSVAGDREVLGLVATAPPSGQQPNVLLAAVHDLLLRGDAHPLADIYAGRTEPGRAPALFRDLCLSRREEIGRMLARRHTQTNEPGRSALLAVGLTAAVAMVGEPIGLLDIGCSAGLNLLIDQYRFEYAPAERHGLGAGFAWTEECRERSDRSDEGRGSLPGPEARASEASAERHGLGPTGSPVTIACELRGPAPVPVRLPTIAARLGVDRAPIDLADADDARWLLACVWPDTGRLARTAAAIDLARRHRPPVIAGDMVDDLDTALDTFDPDLPVVVVTTSACGYLDIDQRRTFSDILRRRAVRRARAGHPPVAWLSTDTPGVVEALPATTGPVDAGAAVMGLVTFDTGTPVGRRLAYCHPHGAWLRWTDGPGP
jgi:hypothetical protein